MRRIQILGNEIDQLRMKLGRLESEIATMRDPLTMLVNQSHCMHPNVEFRMETKVCLDCRKTLEVYDTEREMKEAELKYIQDEHMKLHRKLHGSDE